MSAEMNSERVPFSDGAAHAIHALVAKRQTPAVISPAKPTMRLLIAHDPFAAHSEKIRALRTELLLRREVADQADVVALLSPGIGEGRSQLAAELAIAFAQLGRPTLLVDADLRHPTQHTLFNASNHSGLSQAIERDAEPNTQQVEGLKHLSLLTAGPAPDNPLELLLNRRFAIMIEEWRRTYDFVILDTAPVTHYSDGLAVASLVGRVLALSRARHTPYKDTREMLRRLATTRAQTVGAVINHF